MESHPTGISTAPLCWLLRLFPKRFRDRFGGDLCLAVSDRMAAARTQSLWAAVRLFVAEFWGLLVSAARMRFASRPRTTISAAPRGPDGPRRKDLLMQSLIQDIRYGLRSFARNPGFTAVVVGTLALGIGANTAVFSVVNGVLLKPLPYEQPDRLVSVYTRFLPESGFDFNQFSLDPREFQDYREQSESMEVVGFYWTGSTTLTGVDERAEELRTTAVSAGVFRALRVSPLLGRAFIDDDNAPNAPAVAILEYDFWQTRFGGDPGVVGRTIFLSRRPVEVIGVMPEGFDFGTRDLAMWRPATIDPAIPATRRSSHYGYGIARLAPGVTLEAAEAEMTTLMAGWRDEFPNIHTGHFLFLMPLVEDVVGNITQPLLLLMGAVVFVLLIVCANVANLVLARGENRGTELAIRTAMGAGRARVAQQLVTEGVLLALAGGALGILLAVRGVPFMLALGGTAIPRSSGVALDLPVLVFGAALTGLAGVLFGIIPAWHVGGTDLQSALKDGSRGSSDGGTRMTFRRILVGAEFALSVLLVIGAGLLVRSFGELLKVDPGFRTQGTFVARVSLPSQAYPDDEQVLSFYTGLLERVRALPGVTSAGTSTWLPLQGSSVNDFEIEGREPRSQGDLARNGIFVAAGPSFFETMGMTLERGRLIEERDRLGTTSVVLINEKLASEFWREEDPLGERIRMVGLGEEWATIVGIVGNVRGDGFAQDPDGAYFLAAAQTPATMGSARRTMWLTVRTDLAPLTLARPIEAIISELDSNLPLTRIQTVTDLVNRSMAQPKFTMVLLGAFATLAMMLAAVGIYSVMSYSVARRNREIGIRMALGAAGQDVLRMVVREAMGPALIGLGIGAAAALGVTRLMSSLLYGVSPADPTTFGSVAVIFVGVALVSCAIPALRATRVDPMESMRTE